MGAVITKGAVHVAPPSLDLIMAYRSLHVDVVQLAWGYRYNTRLMSALLPPVACFTAMPGRKWSIDDDTGSMGTRTGLDQFCPFVVVLMTRSLLEHPDRNRQSYQTA